MPESELAEIKNRKDGHADPVAFDVENIDDALNDLKRRGLAF